MCHFVYDVRTADEAFVLRIAQHGNEHLLASSVRWCEIMSGIGVPVPRVLHADLSRTLHPFAYAALERLQGTDLQWAYPQLSSAEKVALAGEIVDVQQRVSALGDGSGFGERLADAVDFPHPSWGAAVGSLLERCDVRRPVGKIVDVDEINRARTAAAALEPYFSRVRSAPFLADTTTKNVLVHAGRLSGIVDLDTVCYGDPTFTLGLAKAATCACGFDNVYTDTWQELLRLDDTRRAALSYYTALFCIDLLSEVGHRFNRALPKRHSRQRIARLRRLLNDELDRFV
jgi:aminoglycoside phosphotransferase (APT) family kinase protein